MLFRQIWYEMILSQGVRGEEDVGAKKSRKNVTQADCRMLVSAEGDDFIVALRAVIKKFRGGAWLSISQTATRAGMSARSLQRKLAAEECTFSSVVEEVRAELAGEMLADASVTVGEIATALGYSTVSNFARAFERWTGQTPTEFRRGM